MTQKIEQAYAQAGQYAQKAKEQAKQKAMDEARQTGKSEAEIKAAATTAEQHLKLSCALNLLGHGRSEQENLSPTEAAQLQEGAA